MCVCVLLNRENLKLLILISLNISGAGIFSSFADGRL